MVVRLVIGLVMTVVALAFAGRRAWTIASLIRSGQPAPDRSQDLGRRLRTQLVEVFGQKRLLKWSVPGLAHFFTFWAFVILLTVYIEAYGALFDPDFAIPLIGHSPVLGFPAGHDRRAVPALARRVRGHPDPQRPGARAPGVAVLRQPHRRRVADPVHDLQRAVDAVLLPRRLLGAGHVPLHLGGVGVDRARAPVHRAVAARAGGGGERRAAAAHRRDAGVPDHRRLQQAPAHLHRADQRLGQAAARRRWARCR